LLLLFVIFVLPAYLIVRILRRRRKAQKQAQASATPGVPDQPAG
jgi:preprotein translocase subunit YajC